MPLDATEMASTETPDDVAAAATAAAVPNGDGRLRRWLRARNAWERLYTIGLLLWIVRVPLVSAVAGVGILAAAPQAQDLFVDWLGQGFSGTLPFFVALLLVWAIPLHISARFLLTRDKRLRAWKKAHDKFARIERWETY